MKRKKEKKKVIGNKSIGKKCILISTILCPIFTCLYIVSIHSNELINETIALPILIAAVFFFLLWITGILLVIKTKEEETKKMHFVVKFLLALFSVFYLGGAAVVMTLLYNPSIGFQDWLITTAMTTMNHQHYATWFYDDYTITMSLENNRVIESGEDTNPDLIEITPPDFSKKIFKNKYEEQVLTKEEGNDLYKIIDINRDGMKGKLAVIYDPSKVKLANSKGLGTTLSNSYGQYLTDISKQNNAVIGINASGFYDPDWNSTGGVPHGIVIANGKLIANNVRALGDGGLIGFTKDNKLVLTRVSAQDALYMGIRDAVDFGPFLIVNGKSSYIKGNGGWGQAPRTAIGQRKDGIVLFLVIDGRQVGSVGADMNDLAKIMMDYGAYNAANLDGGTSSAMTLNSKVITNPRNGSFQAKTRPIPNAWIVVK